MKSMPAYSKEWEKNAEKDPYWAVLTLENAKNGKWDLEDFFSTGDKEIASLLSYLNKINLNPNFQGCALDFGCGVGRLSKALIQYFASVVGIDISSKMLAEAKKNCPKATFICNQQSNLKIMPSESVDFIYSNIVMQHIHPRFQKLYIEEFGRILKKDGLLVMQVVSKKAIQSPLGYIKLIVHKILPLKLKKIILNKLLKKIDSFEASFAIEMNCLSEKEVLLASKRAQLEIKHSCYTNSTDPGLFEGLNFFDSDEIFKVKGSVPFVSKMYFFQKHQC